MAYESLSKPYNERLLNKNTFRGRLHLGRYFWLQQKTDLLKLTNNSVLELGCYDGKAIYYLNNPAKFEGYDANWENGLELARNAWKGHPEFTFFECTQPGHFNPQGKTFDISICQEVLEHLRSDDLINYIKILAASTKQYCFVTIPNESGLFFLAKFIWKKMTQGEDETYSFKEVLYTTFGKIHKVERSDHGHKGFDYKELIQILSVYFDIEDTEGIPYKKLPLSMNFSIGLVLRPKRNK